MSFDLQTKKTNNLANRSNKNELEKKEDILQLLKTRSNGVNKVRIGTFLKRTEEQAILLKYILFILEI